MPLPAPLTPSNPAHLCPDCKGTGADAAKTAAMQKREGDRHAYIRCWSCNGNGLDPTAFFRNH